MAIIACVWCGEEFYPNIGHQKFCSVECRSANYEVILEARKKNWGEAECDWCGDTFKKPHGRSRYCCDECRYQAELDRKRQATVGRGIKRKIAQGAASELVACADLLAQDCDVYRAVHPDAKCDLVAVKDGRVIRVEVKTSQTTVAGTVSHPKPNPGTSDIVAVVSYEGEVYYETPEGQVTSL